MNGFEKVMSGWTLSQSQQQDDWCCGLGKGLMSFTWLFVLHKQWKTERPLMFPASSVLDYRDRMPQGRNATRRMSCDMAFPDNSYMHFSTWLARRRHHHDTHERAEVWHHIGCSVIHHVCSYHDSIRPQPVLSASRVSDWHHSSADGHTGNSHGHIKLGRTDDIQVRSLLCSTWWLSSTLP